jgi:hypothetical protein
MKNGNCHWLNVALSGRTRKINTSRIYLERAPSHALLLELHRLSGAHLYEENMVTTIAKTLADGEIVKYFLAFKTPLHARAANC